MKKYKEYNYDEWVLLSDKDKSDIINNYWKILIDPTATQGQKTVNSIIEQFKKEYPIIAKEALEIGYDFFGFYADCIYVVLKDSKIRVPRIFASIPVNKGVVKKQVGNTVIVDWKLVGGSNCEIQI